MAGAAPQETVFSSSIRSASPCEWATVTARRKPLARPPEAELDRRWLIVGSRAERVDERSGDLKPRGAQRIRHARRPGHPGDRRPSPVSAVAADPEARALPWGQVADELLEDRIERRWIPPIGRDRGVLERETQEAARYWAAVREAVLGHGHGRGSLVGNQPARAHQSQRKHDDRDDRHHRFVEDRKSVV